MYAFLFIAAVSYLLGSIPFGYLLVRIFRGEDVRQSGSGNIGATNVSRKSPLLGVLTLLLDALKGTAAVVLSYKLADRMVAIPTYEQLALAALFAVLGHMFPVWLRFRGGKGVATGLGSFVVIAPESGADSSWCLYGGRSRLPLRFSGINRCGCSISFYGVVHRPVSCSSARAGYDLVRFPAHHP